MAMVVKNNMSAVRTLNTLNSNTNALQKSLQKVSSGMKINSAQDDASGYAISERMRVRIRSLDQANQNTQNDSSLMKTAEGAVGNTVEILRALKEKAINAANDSNTDEDRQTIQKEINQFIDQIDDNALVQFNGKYLIDGSKNNASTASKTILLNQSLHTSTLESTALTNLYNRAGDSLGIQSTDKWQVSWVENGNINFTSGTVGDTKSLEDILNAAWTDEDGEAFGEVKATTEAGRISPAKPESVTYEEVYTMVAGGSVTSGSDLEAIVKGYKKFDEDTAATFSFEELGLYASEDGTETFDDAKVTYTPADSTAGTSASMTVSGPATDDKVYGTKYVNTGDEYIKSTLVPAYDSGDISGTADADLTDFNAEVASLIPRTDLPTSGNGSKTENLSAIGATDADGNAITDADGNAVPKYYIKQTDADGNETYVKADGFQIKRATKRDGDDNLTEDKITLSWTGSGTAPTEIYEYNPNYAGAGGTGFDEAWDKFGKAVYTPDKTPGIAVAATTAGVDKQISGLTISILDQDGNVKKAANAALDQFKQYQRAENETGDMSLNFHIGSEANVAIKVGMSDMRSQALGLKGSDGVRIDVYTKENANSAINVIENALTKALDQQTTIGAIEARLEYTSTNLTTSSENVQAAESTIRDADMAKEMTNYTKSNVLLQAAQAMLAQANQNSSAVLSLLQ